jgi:hypothetical protein
MYVAAFAIAKRRSCGMHSPGASETALNASALSPLTGYRKIESTTVGTIARPFADCQVPADSRGALDSRQLAASCLPRPGANHIATDCCSAFGAHLSFAVPMNGGRPLAARCRKALAMAEVRARTARSSFASPPRSASHRLRNDSGAMGRAKRGRPSRCRANWVGAPDMSFVTSRAAGQRALLHQRNRNTDPDRKAISPAQAAGRSMVTLQTRIETLCSSTENVDRTGSKDTPGTVTVAHPLSQVTPNEWDALRHARGLARYVGTTRGVFVRSRPALQVGSAKRKPPQGRF